MLLGRSLDRSSSLLDGLIGYLKRFGCSAQKQSMKQILGILHTLNCHFYRARFVLYWAAPPLLKSIFPPLSGNISWSCPLSTA